MTRLVVFVVAVLCVSACWPVWAVAEDDTAPTTDPVTVPTVEMTVPAPTTVPAAPSVRPPPPDRGPRRYREAHRRSQARRTAYTVPGSNDPVTATSLHGTTTTMTTSTTIGGLFYSPPALTDPTTADQARTPATVFVTDRVGTVNARVPHHWSWSDLTIVLVLAIVAVGTFGTAFRLRKVRP